MGNFYAKCIGPVHLCFVQMAVKIDPCIVLPFIVNNCGPVSSKRNHGNDDDQPKNLSEQFLKNLTGVWMTSNRTSKQVETNFEN